MGRFIRYWKGRGGEGRGRNFRVALGFWFGLCSQWSGLVCLILSSSSGADLRNQSPVTF